MRPTVGGSQQGADRTPEEINWEQLRFVDARGETWKGTGKNLELSDREYLQPLKLASNRPSTAVGWKITKNFTNNPMEEQCQYEQWRIQCNGCMWKSSFGEVH